MDLWILTEETLESDTKMIRGSRSSQCKVVVDEHGDELDDMVDDKFYDADDSRSIDPSSHCDISQPCKIFATPNTCARIH
jgi:hypothetical protein